MKMQSPAFQSLDPMSQQEFSRWLRTLSDDDLHHYELLDGFIVMEPPVGWPHGEIELEIGSRLKSFLRSNALGRVFGSSQGFDLPTGDTVEPDVAFVSAERWREIPRPVRGFLKVVPDLIVEILSPSTERIDHGRKKRIYRRNGVREYWLVDPRSATVQRLCWTAGGDEEDRLLSVGDILISRVLPGLQIPVAELFPDPQP